MVLALTVIQYLLTAVTDVLDKFLISGRKIEPISYAFFTVVSGLGLLVAWPFVFEPLGLSRIGLDVLSGALFSLSFYLFSRALAGGEASRVIPFIFGIVPVFDLLIGSVTAKNHLTLTEGAALCLLVPGALLISLRGNRFLGRHVGEKVLAAISLSVYFAFWQYAAHGGSVLNHLMWNRIGAAAALALPLVFGAYRRRIAAVRQVERRRHTAALFIFKQLLGGATFVLFSWLLVVSKISVVSSLQGVRYAFLFLLALALGRRYPNVLAEDTGRGAVKQKSFALALIVLGTLILFLL